MQEGSGSGSCSRLIVDNPCNDGVGAGPASGSSSIRGAVVSSSVNAHGTCGVALSSSVNSLGTCGALACRQWHGRLCKASTSGFTNGTCGATVSDLRGRVACIEKSQGMVEASFDTDILEGPCNASGTCIVLVSEGPCKASYVHAVLLTESPCKASDAHVVLMSESPSKASYAHAVLLSESPCKASDAHVVLFSESPCKASDAHVVLFSESPNKASYAHAVLLSESPCKASDAHAVLLSESPDKASDANAVLLSKSPNKASYAHAVLLTESPCKASDAHVVLLSESPNKASYAHAVLLSESPCKASDANAVLLSKSPNKASYAHAVLLSESPCKASDAHVVLMFESPNKAFDAHAVLLSESPCKASDAIDMLSGSPSKGSDASVMMPGSLGREQVALCKGHESFNDDAALMAGYLWGVSCKPGVSGVDMSKLAPSALAAWLTAEPVLSSSHPCRVQAASSATTALRLPEWWKLLPPAVVSTILEAKSQWPLGHMAWIAAGFDTDEDWEFLSYVLQHGAPMCALDEVPAPFAVPNYKSFDDNFGAAFEILKEEIAMGYLISPPKGCAALFLHPMGCVPKKSGSVRIIHDFSAPCGRSVNDAQKYWYRQFSVVDQFSAGLTPGCFIGRLDIKAYYRHFGIDPLFWPLQGLSVNGRSYFDTRMNFGMRNAPEIADRFSSALVRDACLHGIKNCMAVVDDFTVNHPSQSMCCAQWMWLCNRLRSLGFELSEGPGKTEEPAQVSTVLGLVFDTVEMTVGLDDAKLQKLRTSVAAVAKCKKVQRRQLESLVGFLLWVSRVTFAGRSFCHHLKVAARSVARPGHWVYINAQCRRELNWWCTVAPVLNGKYPILPPVPALWKDFQVDASTTGGPGGQPCIGIWMEGAYVSLSYDQLSSMFTDCPPCVAHINTWELYAVLVCVRLFDDYMAGGHWRVRTDSASVEGWLMRGECRDSIRHEYVAEMAASSVSKYFRLTAKHIAGAKNCMADALSRCNFEEVQSLLLKWKAAKSDVWHTA